MANPFDKPLTDDEFVEIGELLASIPEPFEPMEPDRMDGFLTALGNSFAVAAASAVAFWELRLRKE